MSDSSDPMDCSLPGSSVHGIFQARVLEWGAIAFSAPIHCYFCLKTNVLELCSTSSTLSSSPTPGPMSTHLHLVLCPRGLTCVDWMDRFLYPLASCWVWTVDRRLEGGWRKVGIFVRLAPFLWGHWGLAAALNWISQVPPGSLTVTQLSLFLWVLAASHCPCSRSDSHPLLNL